MPYKRQSEPVRKYYKHKNNSINSGKDKNKATQKKRMSFEKKILLQGIVSIVLLLYSVGVSKIDSFALQRQFIHRAVNINATKKDAQNAIKKLSYFKDKCEKITQSGMEYIENILSKDLDENKKTSVKALAMEDDTVDDKKAKIKPETENIEPIQESGAEQGFTWPVNNGEITSNFGDRTHPINGVESKHMGLDIGANHGDTVVSCGKGIVSEAGYDDNLGNYVKVKHSESIISVYGHMSKISVKPDEEVDSTIKIGEVGETGTATGPHLHLEVRVNGVCMNPLDYLLPYDVR